MTSSDPVVPPVISEGATTRTGFRGVRLVLALSAGALLLIALFWIVGNRAPRKFGWFAYRPLNEAPSMPTADGISLGWTLVAVAALLISLIALGALAISARPPAAIPVALIAALGAFATGIALMCSRGGVVAFGRSPRHYADYLDDSDVQIFLLSDATGLLILLAALLMGVSWLVLHLGVRKRTFARAVA